MAPLTQTHTHDRQRRHFLDLNVPGDLIEALARVVRQAQKDHRSGHIDKHRDRTTLKIILLIGIERYRDRRRHPHSSRSMES